MADFLKIAALMVCFMPLSALLIFLAYVALRCLDDVIEERKIRERVKAVRDATGRDVG